MTAAKAAPFRHFHAVYSLHFIRKYIIVYLFPLVRALLVWDVSALLTALRQDVLLFLAMAVFSLAEWQAGGWRLDASGVLQLHNGILFKTVTRVHGAELAAVRSERSVFFRTVHATALTLYYTELSGKRSVTLYLTKQDAEVLADRLLPLERKELYHPCGAEQLALALLSANAAATFVLFVLAVRQSDRFGQWAQTVALEQLSRAAQLAATWLPAGLAWTFTGLGALLCVSLARSFFHTARYRVWKNDGVIGSEGGLLHFSQCRIRESAVSLADVRLTPAARILRHYPVYLSAGAYDGGEIPVLMYRPGQENALLSALLPGFRLPPERTEPTRGRSVVFFLPGGIGFGLFLMLTLVSGYALPGATAVLLFPTALFLGMLALEAEGRRREGAWSVDGRFTARVQKNFTMHYYCVCAPKAPVCFLQSPWAVRVGRTNLTVYLPGKIHLKVRSIELFRANEAARACRGR